MQPQRSIMGIKITQPFQARILNLIPTTQIKPFMGRIYTQLSGRASNAIQTIREKVSAAPNAGQHLLSEFSEGKGVGPGLARGAARVLKGSATGCASVLDAYTRDPSICEHSVSSENVLEEESIETPSEIDGVVIQESCDEESSSAQSSKDAIVEEARKTIQAAEKQFQMINEQLDADKNENQFDLEILASVKKVVLPTEKEVIEPLVAQEVTQEHVIATHEDAATQKDQMSVQKPSVIVSVESTDEVEIQEQVAGKE